MSENLQVGKLSEEKKVDDTHVVVVFERTRPGENYLSPAGQVQEVFGPFVSGNAATEFCNTFKGTYSEQGKVWEFLVLPLSGVPWAGAVAPVLTEEDSVPFAFVTVWPNHAEFRTSTGFSGSEPYHRLGRLMESLLAYGVETIQIRRENAED